MSNLKITPRNLKGSVIVPSSKSLCHRFIIAASLSKQESIISNILFSEDIKATCEAMKCFGACIKSISNNSLIIKNSDRFDQNKNIINCGESGSTLRFLIPVFLLNKKKVVFKGEGKLIERPLTPYYKIFNLQNINWKNNNGKLPLSIEGELKPDVFNIQGNISSQFITGLMFTLPLLNNDSRINIIGELESRGYVDLTINALDKFGVKIINNNYKEFYIEGNQSYKGCQCMVEGDFSQSAFWIVAGLLGENIICNNLNSLSHQGDKAIIEIIKKMDGNITFGDNSLKIIPSKTKGTTINASQCPDLVPILAVLGALSEGETIITNAERLRIKESDRLKAITTELKKLGANIRETKDGLFIQGKRELDGGIVDSWNDHRIAMALAIASIRCKDSLIIKNSEVVKKSYPHFWDDFKKLGGCFVEWDIW